jgi:ribonuclease/clavin/mitogillin
VKQVLKDENASITEAVITHWHHDHTGGQKQLLELSPNTIIYKNSPSEGQLEITDGQTFHADGASLSAVFCPGHAQDHMAFVLEEEDAMFTGDNVLGHGTAVFEDLATYLNSLDQMRRKFLKRAYPGHGPVIEDGPSKILEYISHRKQREEQVIQVLKSSRSPPEVDAHGSEPDEWTSMEIVKIIYRDVPENLHLPANGGVIQILRKLEEEDRVAENPSTERWRVKDRAAL